MHRPSRSASRRRSRMACSLPSRAHPQTARPAQCRRQTTSRPPRLPRSAARTRCRGPAAKTDIAAALMPSLTTCSRRAWAALHPHPVPPLWATTVEVARLSTTPRMWVMAPLHGPSCARKPQASAHTAQARPSTLPSHRRSTLPRPRRLATKTAQVRIHHNKTFLPSLPYPHQSTPSRPSPLHLESPKTSSTAAPLDRHP